MDISDIFFKQMELTSSFNVMMIGLEAQIKYLSYYQPHNPTNTQKQKQIASNDINDLVQHAILTTGHSSKQFNHFINKSFHKKNNTFFPGYCLLHLACQYSANDMSMLINKGANVNKKTANLENALDLVLKNNEFSLEHLLLLNNNGFKLNQSRLNQINRKRPDIYTVYQNMMDQYQLKQNFKQDIKKHNKPKNRL